MDKYVVREWAEDEWEELPKDRLSEIIDAIKFNYSKTQQGLITPWGDPWFAIDPGYPGNEHVIGYILNDGFIIIEEVIDMPKKIRYTLILSESVWGDDSMDRAWPNDFIAFTPQYDELGEPDKVTGYLVEIPRADIERTVKDPKEALDDIFKLVEEVEEAIKQRTDRIAELEGEIKELEKMNEVKGLLVDVKDVCYKAAEMTKTPPSVSVTESGEISYTFEKPE